MPFSGQWGFVCPEKAKKIRKNRSDIIEVADDYFHNAEYYEAIIHYKKAFEFNPKDPYVQYRMGDCNRHMFNYTEAEGYYSRCLEFGPTYETPHPEYWYGLMLKYNGKYTEAKVQFEQFTKAFKPKAKEDLKYYAQAKIELEACDFAIKSMQSAPKDFHFQLLPPPVNTKYSDYAPAFYLNDTTIVVTSTRHSGKADHKFTTTFGDAYSKSYRFEKKAETWAEEKRDDNFNIINGDFNDGAGCFNKNKTKYYYTNCSAPDGTCGIYVTHLKDGKWQKSEPLNEHINKPGTWNGQPSLNETDDTLYFVSKRPGGLGMHDIWFSQCAGRQADRWVEAKNVGPTINTPFSELSPHHYHTEKTLFFSSNGKSGFGGLDIFVAHGDSFQTVANLGLPFNSSKDDFYFTYGRHKGYLCSNRDGGTGSDDIYFFHIDKNQPVLAYLELTEPVDSTQLKNQPVGGPVAENVAPAESTPPADNPVAVNQNSSDPTASASTNNSTDPKSRTGSNSDDPNVSGNPASSVNATTKGSAKPSTAEKNLAAKNANGTKNANSTASSANGNKIPADPTQTQNASSVAATNPSSASSIKATAKTSAGDVVQVVVVKAAPKKEKTVTAATVTSPAKTPTGKNANSISVSGQIVDESDNKPVADAENMLAEENGTIIKKSKTNEKGEFRYDNIPANKNYQILLTEKDATPTTSNPKKKYGVSKIAVTASDKLPSKNLFENVYFDFDKAELRPEAIKILDELYDYWSLHKEVQVEMNAYTDDWGENEYNHLLAEKRGQTSLDYLVNKGMDKSAMVLAAQGESNPLAPNMSLIGRQLNRRIEFSIIGGPGYMAKTMTYVLEPKSTLYSIAKKYGMTVEELKELNGLSDESILAWRPLRVKKTEDASSSIAPVTLEAMQNAFISHNGDSLLTASNQFATGYTSELTLTPEEENIYEIYTVVPQNTMFSIARQFGMSVEEIKSINQLPSSVLRIGQRLKVKKRD